MPEMVIDRLHPGSRIWRLQHRYVPFNSWLVEDGAGGWLVDTGLPGRRGELAGAVRRLLYGRPLLGVLITHAHPDHTGALAEVVETWGAPVWAHAEEGRILTGGRYGPVRAWWGARLVPPLGGTAMVEKVEALTDGAGVGPFVALHTPGHAPGHMAFHHLAEEALICGDVFMHVLPWLTGPIRFLTYDPALNRRAQSRLRELQPVRWLLPSHGKPVSIRPTRPVSSTG